MVKGWGGFMGGFKLKSQWRQKIYLLKKKKGYVSFELKCTKQLFPKAQIYLK